MNLTLPSPDTAQFTPIPTTKLVLACLATAKTGVSLNGLQSRLQKFASEDDVDIASSALIERGEAGMAKTIFLTAAGKAAAKAALGKDAGKSWEEIWKKRLPLVALGVDPDDAKTRRSFAKIDTLRAGAVAVAYKLPGEAMSSAKMVASELVWRLLGAAFSKVIGQGPFKVIETPGPVEVSLLSGLSGSPAANFKQAMDALSSKAVGANNLGPDGFRAELVRVGVTLARETERAPTETKRALGKKLNGDSTFSQRVKAVAVGLKTPPFTGQVAIAQVYDAYGRSHADAGSLESFKRRLVEEAKQHRLDLTRLDMPERISKELRERSTTTWSNDEVHFVFVAPEY